jgi:hypothetical protein
VKIKVMNIDAHPTFTGRSDGTATLEAAITFPRDQFKACGLLPIADEESRG